MKKNKEKDQDPNRQPRRLRLNREILRRLDDPALLDLARGGTDGGPEHQCRTGSSIPTDF